VLPLFLAMGKHLRNDIPALARQGGKRISGLRIEFLPGIGRGAGVRRRAVAIALRAAQRD
jgi:sirohydrochlorin ferrochelatase